MPKIRNRYGVVSIVGSKRAAQMVQEDGAIILDEPDMLPGDPVVNKIARHFDPNLKTHAGVQPTNAQLEQIVAAKEEIIAEEKKELEERELLAEETKRVGRPRKA